MTVEGSAASPEPAGGGHPLTYRPQLDGLRAVAVYLVVAFHSDLGVFSGGFIGVDVFFVLSGFLVTSLLIRDLSRLGRLQWRQFYARRVRRILPAAAVTLVVTAVVYAAIATPLQVLDAVGAFRAAFLYVANWYFIHQSTDYFAADVSRNPVLHFWSLAIEEQFYLIWPLALTALYVASGWTRRWRWWVLRSVVIAAGLASSALAIHISTTNLDRAYYGTETRAYQLLAGAALAVTPQLFRLRPAWTRWAQRVAIAVFAAIAVLATSLVDRGPITRGVLVALLASALIVALEHARGGVVKRVLSAEPVTYLGRISYATYLWHWPLIVFATYNRTVAPVMLFLLDAVAATALAALSFKVLEQPIRTVRSLDRYRGPVIAMGLTLSLVLGLLVMPAILDAPGSTTVAARAAGHHQGPRLLDWRRAKNAIYPGRNCLNAPASKCTLIYGAKRRVLVIGDSHATMWVPSLLGIAKRRHWTLSMATEPGCSWQRGVFINFAGLLFDCAKRQADWYDRLVPRLNPDLVILVDKGYDDPKFSLSMTVPDGKKLDLGDAGYEEGLIDATRKSLDALRKPGRKIAIIEPVPLSYPFDPIECLSTGRPASKCAFEANTKTTPLDAYYHEAARRPDVWTLNFDPLVCPRYPTCDAIVNDIIVRADSAAHLTFVFSSSLGPGVARILDANGLLAGR